MDQSGGHPRDQDDCPNSGGDDRHERGHLRGRLGDGSECVCIIWGT